MLMHADNGGVDDPDSGIRGVASASMMRPQKPARRQLMKRLCPSARKAVQEVKRSAKYRQIAASIAEIGLVEPTVVARSRDATGKFLLLDGHLRLEVLKDSGLLEIECLVSTEDEAFTYNKRVNRIAIIQEHRMILKAIEKGVSEARIAKTLNVDVASIHVVANC